MADNTFLFELVPSDGPLFVEPLADPYSFASVIHIQKAVDPALRPAYLRTAVKVFDNQNNQIDWQYVDLPYDQLVLDNPSEYSVYLHMRVGTSISLLRCRYEGSNKMPPIDAELSIGAALNTLFNIFSNSNALGFDGTWFAGANTRIANKYVLRFGIHHFSGHYGDETLDKFFKTNQIDFENNFLINGDFEGKNPDYNYYYHNYMEYVRDNSWLVGFSADIAEGLRTYGELEIPWNKVWLRPFADAPYSNEASGGGSLLEYLGTSSEGFSRTMVDKELEIKKNSFYHALRAHIGVEYSHHFSNVGTAFIAADLQLHQDGQTKHLANTYSPDNSWDYEITAKMGLILGEEHTGLNPTIELCYHDGRVSTTDFYYQRSKTISIGLSIH